MKSLYSTATPMTGVIFAAIVSLGVRAAPGVETAADSNEGAGQATWGEARLRYGVVLRDGAYSDSGPGLTYSGTTPNDFGFGLQYQPTYLGGLARVQREAFSLNLSGAKVTEGALLRAAVGPSGRILLGPVFIDLAVAYGFAELPSFSPSASPTFGTGTRHAVLLASRGHVSLPLGFMAEASIEYPISFSSHDATGATASSTGIAAGGSLGLEVVRTDRIAWTVLADYQYVSDKLTGSGGMSSSQTLSRVGAGLQLDWLAPPAPPKPKVGGIAVTVLEEGTGTGLDGAQVDLEVGGEHRVLATQAGGRAALADLPPGQWVATVTQGGYLAGKAAGRVVAGQDGAVEVRLRKEPPKTGSLLITFTDKVTGAAVLNGHVTFAGSDYTADDHGELALADLAPGPTSLAATAPGYLVANEVASVVAGQKSPVAIHLVPAQKKPPAQITGLVRSTQTGHPIAAALEIPEARVKTRADAKGAFLVRVPGGSYRVIISAPGYLTQTKNVTVKDGDEAIFNVDLHPQNR